MGLSTIDFVNLNGAKWAPSAAAVTQKKKVKNDAPEKYHRGWRVMGLSDAHIAAAQKTREDAIRRAKEHNARIESGLLRDERMRVPPPFDREVWLANASLKPIRSKPYEIPGAAEQCAEIARKSGWHRVSVEELKKGKE